MCRHFDIGGHIVRTAMGAIVSPAKAGVKGIKTVTDVTSWLGRFEGVLAHGRGADVADMFTPEGLWRDIVAFGWTLGTYEGRGAIASMVDARAALVGSHSWQTEAAPGAIEGFVTFKTLQGSGRGYLRLIDGKALCLLTTLQDIAGHDWKTGSHRASGVIADAAGRNW